MSKKGKTGVPGRKLKYGLSEADFRKVVKQYVVSKMCKEFFAKAKIEVLKAFFVGVVQGYEDFFHFMYLKDEEFLAVFNELDSDSMKLEAKVVAEKIMERSKKKRPALITDLSGVVGAREFRAVKEIFDKQMKIGGKG